MTVLHLAAKTEAELAAALAQVQGGLFVTGGFVPNDAWLAREGFGTALRLHGALKAALIAELEALDLRVLGVWHIDLDTADIARIAAALPGLTTLVLDGNGIGEDGAKEIAQRLSNLTTLDLSRNSIGDDGAKEIAQRLSNLTTLVLGVNRIGDDGAKAIAQRLSNLTKLNLWDNSIGDDGVKEIAQRLSNLTTLNLWNNSIGDDGGRALLDGFMERGLERLSLHGNPLTETLLTPEAFGNSDAKALLAAWADFRMAEGGGDLVKIREAKMLVLGHAAVGKSSLVRYLLRGEARDPDEKATRGVSHHRIRTEAWEQENGATLNVWDFGGQEIQHGTHRYFLTERSLYLIVLSDRPEDGGMASVETWLGRIRSVAGDDAPVIVVVNKCDEGARKTPLDEARLLREPQVKAVVNTACNDDAVSRDSMMALRGEVLRVLEADLPDMNKPLPASYLAVKDAVAERAAEARVLTDDAYADLCREHGVDNADSRRGLLRLLHQFGTVVAYGLEAGSDAAMKSVRLLDPNWLTTAIYTVLEKVKVEERGGVFSRGDLAEWLDAEVYDAEHHEFVVAMMRDPKLSLCYRLPGEEERFLAPEGLPVNSPGLIAGLEGAGADMLRFRYRYDSLPRGLVPRLIVGLHTALEDPPMAWLSGMRLRIGEATVVVEGGDKVVEIAVTGDGRLSALTHVRRAMEEAHGVYAEIGAQAVVPMPGDAAREETLEHLVWLAGEKGMDHMVCPSGARRDYRVGDLLAAVDADRGVGRKEAVAVARPALLVWAVPGVAGVLAMAVAWWELGTGVLWALVAGAVVGGAIFAAIRYFDPAYLFRRVFVVWLLLGGGLLASYSVPVAMLERLGWLPQGTAAGPSLAVMAIWLTVFAPLAWMAREERG